MAARPSNTRARADVRKRVLAASLALSTYAAACGPTTPEPYNQAADTEKMDYARPATIEKPSDWDVRVPRARAARNTTRPRSTTTGGCTLDDIKRMESGGRYDAQNPHSSASGAYQVLRSTWNGYGGYSEAKDAPREVQDQFAAELYARSGTQPWVVCR